VKTILNFGWLFLIGILVTLAVLNARQKRWAEVVALGIALLLGIALSIYFIDRPSNYKDPRILYWLTLPACACIMGSGAIRDVRKAIRNGRNSDAAWAVVWWILSCCFMAYFFRWAFTPPH
jgi:uncharacterized membrane protein YoaT (DUF817 family)